MRGFALLPIALLSACVEVADAQPRPDAGRRLRVGPADGGRGRQADPQEALRNLLGIGPRTDGSVSSVVGDPVRSNALGTRHGAGGGPSGFSLTGTEDGDGASFGSLGGSGRGGGFRSDAGRGPGGDGGAARGDRPR